MKGQAALVGLNEGQQISSDSYCNARGATVDAGGFSIIAANPPLLGDVGTWVPAGELTDDGEHRHLDVAAPPADVPRA